MRLALALASLSLTLLAFSSTAQAGEGCQQDADSIASHIFDASDANGDGALSPEEYSGAGLERYGVDFEAFDADGDGATSRQEYLDLFQRHHPPAGSRNI